MRKRPAAPEAAGVLHSSDHRALSIASRTGCPAHRPFPLGGFFLRARAGFFGSLGFSCSERRARISCSMAAVSLAVAFSSRSAEASSVSTLATAFFDRSSPLRWFWGRVRRLALQALAHSLPGISLALATRRRARLPAIVRRWASMSSAEIAFGTHDAS